MATIYVNLVDTDRIALSIDALLAGISAKLQRPVSKSTSPDQVPVCDIVNIVSADLSDNASCNRKIRGFIPTKQKVRLLVTQMNTSKVNTINTITCDGITYFCGVLTSAEDYKADKDAVATNLKNAIELFAKQIGDIATAVWQVDILVDALLKTIEAQDPANRDKQIAIASEVREKIRAKYPTMR